MRNKLILFSKTLILACLFACNAGDENRPKDTKADSTDSNTQKVQTTTSITDECDYYVDKLQVDSMIDKYNTEFHKSGLTKEFWVEACVIKSIGDFLKKHPSYDGIRFFLGGDRVGLSVKSILLIVPTTLTESPLRNNKHSNQFGSLIPLTGGCSPTQVFINRSFADASKKLNLFGKKFRDEVIEGQRSPANVDPLSIGIWISRCKVEELLKLYTPENNLDGLMGIAAAYYKDDERRARGERKYVIQSTLVFVPTRNRIPAWNVVPKPPVGWKDGGFNHGSLCPDDCY